MENGFDPLLIEFVKENLVSIGVVLALLKGIAKITPSASDDRIVSLLSGILASFRPGQKRLTNGKG